ncbi:hypothetical protein U9M48_040774 [Paspalum notatum var. saurae]|uniref:RNA polymerase sigma-70 domain-containing protein n=1 Tax=Paspalum notatum var. saurae TaxID=547442 RepID=A0AAQ3UME5_PASNO
MTATPAVIGLSAGNRLLATSFDLAPPDAHPSLQFAPAAPKLTVVAHRAPASSGHARGAHAVRALRNHSAPALAPPPPPLAPALPAEPAMAGMELGSEFDFECSLEAIVLLQRSMLEKQWELPVRRRRLLRRGRRGGGQARRGRGPLQQGHGGGRAVGRVGAAAADERPAPGGSGREEERQRQPGADAEPEPHLPPGHRQQGAPHAQAGRPALQEDQGRHLAPAPKIKEAAEMHADISYKFSLKEKLGNEPSYKQLAQSLRISAPELRARMRESFLAREMLTMSNIRLVISIAQKYENLGVELADLIQGGLIGLLRGIEKFDASRGFRISTYVYWWIRQGVSRALAENSKTFRLPTYLHERLIAIRGAKYALEDQGIPPTIENIAGSLNISKKKVHNATEAVNKVLSLDQQAFPSLNGLPGDTLHSYIEDQNVANDPWHGFEEGYLKEEVNNLIDSTLNERERDIIRLYHGIGKQCHTWEDISRQFGLSRERVRQVGLVAKEKLKHAARRKHLDALLEDY